MMSFPGAQGEGAEARSLERLGGDARAIFSAALAHTEIGAAFDQHLHFEGTVMVQHPFRSVEAVLKPVRTDLAAFREVLVIAFGKAAVPMLNALLTRLPRGIRAQGICAAPDRLGRRFWRIHSYIGGHPLPNEDSFRAARHALRLLARTTARSFVFFLVSGGGSALFELPLDPGISLPDTIAFHEALIGSGATISEINIVRKHFSAVKGGRLAAAAPEAEKLTLQISDVPVAHLEALASGPTIPDRSSIAQCDSILARYNLLERFPSAVRSFFMLQRQNSGRGSGWDRGVEAAGTAAAVAAASRLDTLLSNHDLVNAAREQAQHLGFRVVIDNSCDEWSYERAAEYLLERLAGLRKSTAGRVCLLSGGEVLVRLARAPGTGGRNQQFALACALTLASPAWRGPGSEAGPVVVLSGGSDGIDGNSPAAGAVVDTTTVARARSYGFEPEEALARFDACPLFTALGDTLVTGATGHNLRDLRILLAG